MWADPVDNSNGALDSLVKTNDVRGCSYYFGYELSKGFLKKNKLISIIRAHEAQQTGFKMYNWSGKKSFPTVITIFSAPNYCDFYNNKGAVIKLMVIFLINIEQYSRYSAIFRNASSIFFTLIYGFILVVNTFCFWKSDIDVSASIEAIQEEQIAWRNSQIIADKNQFSGTDFITSERESGWKYRVNEYGWKNLGFKFDSQ